jgi:hypothetical protein
MSGNRFEYLVIASEKARNALEKLIQASNEENDSLKKVVQASNEENDSLKKVVQASNEANDSLKKVVQASNEARGIIKKQKDRHSYEKGTGTGTAAPKNKGSIMETNLFSNKEAIKQAKEILERCKESVKSWEEGNQTDLYFSGLILGWLNRKGCRLHCSIFEMIRRYVNIKHEKTGRNHMSEIQFRIFFDKEVDFALENIFNLRRFLVNCFLAAQILRDHHSDLNVVTKI